MIELSDSDPQKPTGLFTKISFVIVMILGILQWALAIIPDFVSHTNFDFEYWGIACLFSSLISVLAITITGGLKGYRFFSQTLFPPILLGVALILSLPLVGKVNGYLNGWQFHRQMEVYNRIVNDVKTGKIRADIVDSQIERLPVPILKASVVRCSHGAVVEFHKHGRCGYLFDDCDDAAISRRHRKPEDQRELPLHIQGPWYKFCVADSSDNIE